MTTPTPNATATTTTPASLILAIDLGKYKSVACRYAGPDSVTFESFTTDRTRLRKLLEHARPAVVVIEACLLAGWVHDLCAELDLVCRVANTASDAWKFKHLKRKTDKDDALRLAQLQALGQLPAVCLPPDPRRPPRRRLQPHPRPVRRPGPARPARRQGLGQGRPRGARRPGGAAGRVRRL
jgi:hypothetical protein